MDIKQLLWQKKTYETYNTRISTEETNKRQIKHKEFIVSSCTKKKMVNVEHVFWKEKTNFSFSSVYYFFAIVNRWSDNPRILFFRFNFRTQITINEIYIYRE